MAKKVNRRTTVAPSPGALRSRVQRAMNEGRWQQALELGNELYRQDATPANRELLLEIHLGRARQLRQQGHSRASHTVLKNAVELAGDEARWMEAIAEELAAIGQVSEALALLQRVPDSQAQRKVLERAADAALAKGAAGRSHLPENLQPGFDLVIRAFAQLAAGQDEAARETLQGIGLQSPFLEWKLLLRGFLAYYQNDDARALENWGRLRPDRIPSRLAAPFRFRIDPPCRQAQSPETQAQLQRQADRLQGSGLVPALRNIQAALSHEELKGAFQLASAVLPALRQESPKHVARLASCFYWAIIHHGEPTDLARYKRTFDAPPDDPQLDRLSALALEVRGQRDEAHQAWLQFEKAVADHPEAWPTGQVNQVRALIWCHMGLNAEADEPDEQPRRRKQSGRSPSTEACFRRALELAPEQRQPYELLFGLYHSRKEHERAIEIARLLLERFPDHGPTLEALGGLYLELGRHAEGLDLLRRALRANPLDRELRARVGKAHLLTAHDHAEASRFDEARAEFQAALADSEGMERLPILGQWAACEFKADNNARAEELLAEAGSQPNHTLGLAFLMVAEAIRLKLARPLKARFEGEFKAALAAPATAEETVAALMLAAALRVANVAYRAQKSHEKQLIEYLGRVPKKGFAEGQLQQACTSLLALKDATAVRKFTELGRKRFPRNPHFPYLEAKSHMLGKRLPGFWHIGHMLMEAERLAQELPQDEKTRQLLDLIRADRGALGIPDNPFAMLGDLFGRMSPDEFDDDW